MLQFQLRTNFLKCLEELRKIPMSFRNAENSPVTLLKGDSTTGALPVILKILGTLPRRFLEETVFSIVTPSFTTDFMKFLSFIQMKILRKMISCKNWKIPWKTAVLKFVFVKLQAYCVQDCNSTTSRLHHRFFSEYVPRTTCLIKNTLSVV